MKLILQIALGIMFGGGPLLVVFRISENMPKMTQSEETGSAEKTHAGDFKLSRTIPVCNKANLAFDADDYAYCMPPTHIIRAVSVPSH